MATLEFPITPGGTKPFVIGMYRSALSDTHTLLEDQVVDEAANLVEEALGTKIEAYYNGHEPSVADGAHRVHVRDSVIVWMNEEDVASEVRRLRALYRDAPILVLSLCLETRLARKALLSGADGFVYPGMQPVQIVKLLEMASKGESLVPGELLEAFLIEAESRADLATLTTRQREILMLIARSGTPGGEAILSRELLEDFLMGIAK
jgi:DNA-binding NarL/FixJ family response regulator